jgi:hypothetical protein
LTNPDFSKLQVEHSLDCDREDNMEKFIDSDGNEIDPTYSLLDTETNMGNIMNSSEINNDSNMINVASITEKNPNFAVDNNNNHHHHNSEYNMGISAENTRIYI